MKTFLDNTASTDQSSRIHLPPGDWKFLADIPSGDAASVAVSQRRVGGVNDVPVTFNDTAVALTASAPTEIVISTGEEFSVQRSGGSGAISVTAIQIEQ